MINIKISILSNINVDPIISKMSKKHDVYETEGYNTWIKEILDDNSGLKRFSPEVVFVLLDGHELLNLYDIDYEEAKYSLDEYLRYIKGYAKKNPETNIFISNLDMEQKRIQSLKEPRIEKLLEGYWYESLVKTMEVIDNIYIFDIKNIVEEIGRNQFYSKKAWYLGGIKFSPIAKKVIVENLNRYIKAVEGKRKKCLVLDLDNTLWGGVVGEDGITGIELSDVKEGARYKDFQKRIKELKELGTVLTIVSKNNHEDGMQVIRNHKDMILKEEDFILAKINWRTKAENIVELAQELNIGLDSLVFIDDNPIERESIKSLIPEVEVPDFPIDSSELEKHILEIYNDNFLALNPTEEDKNKSEMYKSNIKRKQSYEKADDFNEFLKGLETKVSIWKAKDEDVERAAQLTQKTNQFNLTTIRYTISDIKKFIDADDHDVYIGSVKDKFGDNGKVILAILKKESKLVKLDTFIMSCRVMGRFIEDMVVDFIEEKYREKGCEELITSYIPTERNKPVETLFDRLGYEVIDLKDDGSKKYKLNLKMDKPTRNIYGELNKD